MASIAAFEIFRPVTFIINLSLKQCINPDNLNISTVIPIFKQGFRDSCDDNRPKSVFLLLSEIVDECIYNQLMYYVITENIITPSQYGFMPTLNLKTTKYFIFQSRQKINFNLLPLLILAREILEEAPNIKYIGIVIDHHLSWLDLIDYLCEKISRSTKVMTKVKRYFGKH